MHAFKLFIFILSAISLGGCAPMISTMAVSTPVPNYVYLHENPHAGDFARYRSFDGSQIMMMEITDAENDGDRASRYGVRVSWPMAKGPASGFLREYAYHFTVSPDGRVAAAELVHIRTGKVQPLKVAGPGEFGFISTPELKPLNRGEAIVTTNGTSYGVDRVLVYEENKQGFAGPALVTSTNFISSKTPFGLVQQINAMQVEVTMVEVVKLINEFSPTGTLVKELVNFIADKSKHQKAENGMELIEAGRK